MHNVTRRGLVLPAFAGVTVSAVFLSSLFLVLVTASWIGYLGSDDVTYARGGYGWLREFPYVGGHGTIRYTITIPIALSFAFLGESEYSLVLPSLLYALAFVIVTYLALVRFSGMENAFCALLVLVTSPLLVVLSSVAGVDAIELLFLFLSFFLYYDCVTNGVSLRKLFAAGAFAGLGFLTRETSIFIAVFYGVLFLSGYGFKRRYYWMVAVGFFAIWALEIAYLTMMTGDPLYRFNISLHIDRSSIGRADDFAGNMGNTVVHPVIDPLLVLLFNQEFAFLYWFGIPLCLWLCFRAPLSDRLRRFSRLLSLFGLTWFVSVGAAITLLRLLPRYFLITTAVVCLLTGIALVQLWKFPRARKPAAAFAVLLLLGNLAGLYVENKDFMFGERTLVDVASGSNEPIVYTDPMTRHRALLLLEWRGVESKVTAAGPPRPGGLYLYNVFRATKANRLMGRDEIDLYKPKSDWLVEREIAPSPPVLGLLLERLGFAQVLPARIWRKLRYRHPGVVLYRLPPE